MGPLLRHATRCNVVSDRLFVDRETKSVLLLAQQGKTLDNMLDRPWPLQQRQPWLLIVPRAHEQLNDKEWASIFELCKKLCYPLSSGVEFNDWRLLQGCGGNAGCGSCPALR